MVEVKHITFCAYALAGIFHGILLGAFGPVLLYFSKVTHQDQTSFSYIFLAKAVGFLVGGYLAKILTNCFSFHKIFAVAIALTSASLICSSLDFGFWNLTITMIAIGAFTCVFEIMSTLCIFELFQKNQVEHWIQIVSISFVSGGLLAPFITLLTQELSLRAIGILILLCITPLLLLKSPQLNNNGQKKSEAEEQHQLLQIPLTAEIVICLLMFIHIGLISSYPNWMPTYAVKTGQFDRTSANLLISLFWVVTIVGKILQLFIPGTIQQKCHFLMRCLCVFVVITMILQWLQMYKVLCYFGAISAGLFLSPLYALIFTIAQQHGFKLGVSGTANLSTASILAQGVLIAPVGYIMGHFGFKSYIYLLVGTTFLMYFLYAYVDYYLQKYAKEKRNLLKLPN